MKVYVLVDSERRVLDVYLDRKLAEEERLDGIEEGVRSAEVIEEFEPVLTPSIIKELAQEFK